MGAARGRRRSSGRGLPEHQRHDVVLVSARAFRDPDGDAVAQNRRPVAQRGDFRHAVRDEDDGVPHLAPAPHHRVDALGQVRGKRSGDLVEEQDRRVGGERAAEIDQPQQRIGKIADQLPEIEAGDAELAEPFAHRIV